MKKEKECYEVPRADIVDIRMESPLLNVSGGGTNLDPEEYVPSGAGGTNSDPGEYQEGI